jgi:hypothetical protein
MRGRIKNDLFLRVVYISLFIIAAALVISLPNTSKIYFILAQVFKSDSAAHDGSSISDSKVTYGISRNILIQYTLGKINDERAKLHLPLLKLSDNKAAQVHADDLLKIKSGEPSHFSKNGMKPYMIYTLFGGSGYVEQNVAISGYDNNDSIDCKLRCHKLNPYEQISKIQWSMLYNDSECCQNRHRINILDNHHTNVSIGIAYNDYYFALVENFENNYIKLKEPISQDKKHINIVGRIEPATNVTFTVDNIAIYYDPIPSASFYEKNKYAKSYSLGTLSGLVVKPAPLFYQYQKPINYKLIEASAWHDDNQVIEIRFDLSSMISKKGVYTIVTYLNNHVTGKFPAMLYSIFIY